MNQKFQEIKTRIIRRGIKSGVAVVGIGVVFGVLNYMATSTQENITKLKRENQRITVQIVNLRQKLEDAQKTLERHENLTSQGDLRPLELDRKYVSRLVNELAEEYFIEDVTIDIAPVEEKLREPFLVQTGKIITSSIRIKYLAPSDVQSIAFAQDLMNKFSGYLNIRGFTVLRDDKISISLLERLASSGKGGLIYTTLQFDWLGLRSRETDDQSKAGGS